MSNLTTADTADWQNQTEGQHRSGRSGSGRHRTSRSPERQQYSQQYSQQQAEHLRRKQQQHQGQPRQQHPQQHQYPQQYGGAGSQPQPQRSSGRGVQPYAPTTGQFRSGHIEVDTLYSGQDPGQVRVNSMNAPNNSTMQCGCENIDCPFCNLMTSVQMSS